MGWSDGCRKGLASLLLITAVVTWLVESIWVAHFAWRDVNFDALSYIGIARHLADGNFPESINGYWSPLISWIVALGTKLFVNPLFAARWMSIATFVSCAVLLYCLSQALWNSRIVSAVAVLWFVLSGHVVANSVNFIGADLLFTTITTGYFLFAFKCYRRKADRWWVGIGAMFALAFLAKGFALPWLLLTTMFLLFQIHWKKRAGLVKHATLAFILPAIVWFGWSSVLQTKYHRFMSGYQFRHQVASLMMKKTWIQPGPAPATFVDERPFVDEYMVVDPIPPDSSLWKVKISFREIAPRLFRNEARNVIGGVRGASVLWSAGGWIAFVACGWMLWRRRDSERLSFFLLTLFSGSALVFGYGLMAIEARYLLPISVLVIAVGSRVIVSQELIGNGVQTSVLVAAIASICIIAQAIFLNAYGGSPLRTRRDFQAPYRDIGRILIANPGNVVSYGVPPNSALGIGWEAGYYASFFGGQRLVGFSTSLPGTESSVCDDLNLVAPRSVTVWGSQEAPRYSDTLGRVETCGYSLAAKALDPVDGEIGSLLVRHGANSAQF
jgi:4-amino-4-deoxy-L-arabinose transferase-like glycosyltransferase